MRRLKVESDQGIRTFPLPQKGDLKLGSARDNDIVIDVDGVSRRHARLSLDGGDPRLFDLGSKNQLIVRGRRRREAVLKPGSAVRLGKALLLLEDFPTSDAEIGLSIDRSSSATVSPKTTTDSVPIAPELRSPETALGIVRRFQTAALVGETRRRFLDDARAVLGAQTLMRSHPGTESGGADRPRVEDLAGPLPPEELWAEIVRGQTAAAPELELLSTGRRCLRARSSEGGSVVVALWDAAAAGEIIDQWAYDFLDYLGQRLSQREPVEEDDEPAPDRMDDLDPPPGMVLGSSGAIGELLDQIRASLSSREDALLEGETGTGKELFARLLHRSGPTSKGPFLAVNCAAIPGELLEAELFGVARRVATGVDPRSGLFELADGGTLLLDEVGDLPAPLQAKLLRVLQEREIQPLGAPRPRPIDVRVISTAQVGLAERVAAGTFRADLFYRLDRLHFEIPPLRKRPEDIPVLTQTFVQQAARKNRRKIRGLSVRALRMLTTCAWPGNVRQLRSVVERAVLSCRGETLSSEHFPSLATAQPASHSASSEAGSPATPEPGPKTLKDRLDAEEKRAILEALAMTGGKRSAAARHLDITRQGLFNKMRRLGLNDRSSSD